MKAVQHTQTRTCRTKYRENHSYYRRQQIGTTLDRSQAGVAKPRPGTYPTSDRKAETNKKLQTAHDKPAAEHLVGV